MKIALRAFLGEQPRVEKHRLPDVNASIARNVKLFRGNIEPFKRAAFVTTLAKVGEKKAIYRFGANLDSDSQHWFHWLNDTDVARGPTTGNDTQERTYYCEATQPMKMTDATIATGGAAMPVTSYLTGLPAPTPAATVAVSGVEFLFNTTTDVNGTTDVITETAHGFVTGATVVYLKNGGAAAIGLAEDTTYYVRAVTADTLALYLTAADATNDTNRIQLTAAGAETHTIRPAGTSQQVLVGYTYVNAWDQEGPMSAVSTPVNYYNGQTLTVSSLATGVAGAYNIDRKRVYVAQSDATGRTVLRFWKELALATTSTSGQIDFVNSLGAAAQSPEPVAPPSDLTALRAHPNGFMVGLSPVSKKFCRSEVFKPYAWPTEYQDPLDIDVVGLEVIGQSVVICTKGPTYLASGNDPLRILPVRLEGKQPCVSKRSIRLTNVGVIYASPDGLVAVTPDGRMELVTRTLFTRDQWQAYKPESMHAEVHDERYFCWWYADQDNKGLMIFDFTGDGLGVIHCDAWFSAAYSDPRRDALFVADPEQTNHLAMWDAANNSYYSARWRSKKFVLDRPQNLGAAQVIFDIAAGQTLNFYLYGDGALKHSEIGLSSTKPFQMPRNYRAREYEIEVFGTATVKEILVAATMGELAA